MTANGYRVSLRGYENLLKLVMMALLLCEYTKNHQIIHFKRVDLTVCELYLDKLLLKK